MSFLVALLLWMVHCSIFLDSPDPVGIGAKHLLPKVFTDRFHKGDLPDEPRHAPHLRKPLEEAKAEARLSIPHNHSEAGACAVAYVVILGPGSIKVTPTTLEFWIRVTDI